jgi:hypothetical protein
MREASWQCPDPLCGGTLNRHKRKRVAVDPRTDKEVGEERPRLVWGRVQIRYRDPLIGVGLALQFLIWIGVGYVIQAFFPGRTSHSPLALVFGTLGFIAGVAIYFVIYKISWKRRKAALARAVWNESYRCQRCWKWWMFPEADQHEATLIEGGRQTEETPAG